jgi:putative toxin-antitoxin system antitoxin component (TIGR02293 family)
MNIHNRSIRPTFEYRDIARGISAKSVMAMIGKGALAREDVFRVIAERTMMRRVAANEKLRIEEADAIARLLRVRALAHWAFPDAKSAEVFLTSSNPSLGNESPRALAATDAGAREVEALLNHFVFGDVG